MTTHSGGSGLRELATFWHGPPLARLDIACLLSFIAAGFEVTVYGYEPVVGLPAAVDFRPADEIVDRRFLAGFVVQGKPSLSHFSDLFRYRLFTATSATWVDMDLLCIHPFEIPAGKNFFSKERPGSISSSILRIDGEEPALRRLVSEAEALGTRGDFTWGSTGPALLTKTFGADVLAKAYDHERFFPVPWDAWWKPFLPSAREECDRLCANASAIHLWNNIVERSGYWKDLAPPAGSYLHEVLRRQDLLPLFREVCPERVMEHIAHNYRDSRTADHMPVRQLVGITVPRMVTALRRRVFG